MFGSLETPLTLAAQLDDPVEVIKALRNGGAHLDFRAKDGMTALHKAARARSLPALKVQAGPVSHGDAPSSDPLGRPCPTPHPTTATCGDPKLCPTRAQKCGLALLPPRPWCGCFYYRICCSQKVIFPLLIPPKGSYFQLKPTSLHGRALQSQPSATEPASLLPEPPQTLEADAEGGGRADLTPVFLPALFFEHALLALALCLWAQGACPRPMLSQGPGAEGRGPTAVG